ncbi:aconitate hydratase [Thalassospiraceae bacterium LMO-SO8]|nr:aconitate hydratase [Alphaproteobacteria bacterium LMO-S08]WND77181.1 aconitate hydratase [Thalassospiraceae bacterium LMO-SO8]
MTAADTAPAIDLTPEAAERVYRTTELNLAAVRRRLDRPLTLAEKIVLGHLDDPETQALEPGTSFLNLRPDRVVFQDVLGQSAMLQFMQTGRERVAVAATIHCDHLIEARNEAGRDLSESLNENEEVYGFLKSAAARFGLGFWAPGAGIIHQVVLENYAFPGAMIIGTDSHTPNGGGLGACASGVGGADATEVLAGLPWELLYPKRIAVYLTGSLGGWTAPKDVILAVARELTVSGGTNAIIEYIGPGARTISATGKATITNMGAEVGATTSIFPFDDRMARYLEATGRGEIARVAERYRHLLEPDPAVEANPRAHYDRVIEIDLSALEPHVAGPHSPDRARPLSDLIRELDAADNAIVEDVSAVLIGSCTNSSYEDMSRAARVADQASARGMTAAMPFFVSPGSAKVLATITREGQLKSLEKIGAVVLANACGPCIGQWRRAREGADAPNSIVTSFNRNFPARTDGRPTTMNFITSPEIATAFALAGTLRFNPATDSLTAPDGTSFKLAAPGAVDDVPAGGMAQGNAAYHAPPADGGAVGIRIAANSERLQALEPWSPWDGRDITDALVLAKTKGKTTTDDISPAGPWLRLRGHLDKFSDNLLMGAVNAYTGERGRGLEQLSVEAGVPFSAAARAYRAADVPWVIVGDANYGEGSSREHAALSPRLLGGVAVIARSFARIHETNLKKQGLLALTFADPGDYDRIAERDRLSLLNLAALAPGKPVECRLRHADGTAETLWLNHTYTASQIEWFRAGSALNLMRPNADGGILRATAGAA